VREQFHRLLAQSLRTAAVQAHGIDGCGPTRLQQALGLLRAGGTSNFLGTLQG